MLDFLSFIFQIPLCLTLNTSALSSLRLTSDHHLSLILIAEKGYRTTKENK
jgi:hypothetical protein